ncbi:class I SAM-dependent methyltransferase [Nocardioides gilvus]|uniref:class I SAM-dependent methyltransferase n=1 Tax=Nocardioides gilvus TaxID=1735589 RepID=UPI000D740E4F|nr:class I SAM-dependent methyltransferase [Nocardioides gilvus]
MASERPPGETRGSASVAAAHLHGRPGHPPEAVKWLVPGNAKTVLELGAGIGRLTEHLVAAGHAVHAVDRDPAMVQILRERVSVPVTEGTVEDLDLEHRSVDAVVCSTAFTSFDLETALPAIAKALRTGGHLSVVWHERDGRIPWVRRLGTFLEGPLGGRDNEPSSHSITEHLLASPLFSFVEEETYTVWQDVNHDNVADLVLSRSWVADLSPQAREQAVAEVRAFYDDYGRGMDGMQLPYKVHCVRTQVVHQPGLFDDGTDALKLTSDQADGESEADGADEGEAGDSGRRRRTPFRFDEDLFLSDGTDTDMLLIDFR